MTAARVLPLAFALDYVVGDPPNAIHPVAWVGHAIAIGRDWSLRRGPIGQLARGALMAIGLPAAGALATRVAMYALRRSSLVHDGVAAIVLKTMFAARGLRDAGFAVRDALERDDLAAAREALRSLCSRDPADLSADELVAATVESIAENASDSIVAPFFYYAVGGLPAAVAYRCVNTLDAMVGYRGRFEYAGKAAARLDDVANLAPSRITALLLLAAGALTGDDTRQGLAILRRDGARTESPNAGRPMAAMAGLLGVRLSKPGHYALGDQRRDLGPAHITRAWNLVALASLGALGIATLATAVRRDR